MTNLLDMKLVALVDLYNTAIADYAPQGFSAVDRFKSKAHAVERINALCEASSLAVAFDNDEAIIIDAMEQAPAALPTPVTLEAVKANIAARRAKPVEESVSIAFGAEYSDGKGGMAESGFLYASPAWLAANPRGTAARELYRDMRKRYSRGNRRIRREIVEANETASE